MKRVSKRGSHFDSTGKDIRIGDIVKMSRAWMRSCGIYSGPEAHFRGTVTEINPFSNGSIVAAKEGGEEMRALAVNWTLAKRVRLEAN